MSSSDTSERISVRIAPTTPADLPGVAACELLAFSGAHPPYDALSNLLCPIRAPLARSGAHPRHWPGFQSSIRHRAQTLRDGSMTFTAFILDDTGNEVIAGWAKLTPPKEVVERARKEKIWKERVLDDIVYPVVQKARNALWKDSDGTDTEVLKVFRGAQYSARERINKEGRYALPTLIVHPSYQRRGVGSALLRRCIDIADSSNTPLYLEASPPGVPLYKRFGFVEIDEVRFSCKGVQIVLPCMIRQPVARKEEDQVMKEVDDLVEQSKRKDGEGDGDFVKVEDQ